MALWILDFVPLEKQFIVKCCVQFVTFWVCFNFSYCIWACLLKCSYTDNWFDRCTFWNLWSFLWTKFILESRWKRFCESWKTLEFGLCKSWKVLGNSILLSVRTLCPSFVCSTSWPGTLHFILHTFLHPSFTAHAHTITTYPATAPRSRHPIPVSLPTLHLELHPTAQRYTSIRPPHPTCQCATPLSHSLGPISMQHTTSHTTAAQSPSHHQRHIPAGKQRHQPKLL